MDMNITKEWFEKRSALEGEMEIGAGKRTMCVNLTQDELAELERLIFDSLPSSIKAEITSLREEIERLKAERDQFKELYECFRSDAIRLNNEKCDAKWPDSNILIAQEKAKIRRETIDACARLIDERDWPKITYEETVSDMLENAVAGIRVLAEQEEDR